MSSEIKVTRKSPREIKKPDGKSYRPKHWQLVVMVPEPNPRYKEDSRNPEQRIEYFGRGEDKVPNPAFVKDDRKDAEKRPTVWRQRTKVVHGSKDDALKELNSFENEIIQQLKKSAAPSQTVVEYVTEFVKSKRNARTGQELSVATRDSYRFALMLIDRPELQIPVCDIKAKTVEKWLKGLREEGRGEAMLVKAFRLLNQAMKKAAKDEVIPYNPLVNIDVTDGKPVMPSKSETVSPLDRQGLTRVNDLLRALDHSQLADCAQCALLTGMREGEICGLRWMDVSGWDSGEFKILAVRNVIQRDSRGTSNKPEPKNGEWRKFDISEELADLLSHRLSVAKASCEENGIEVSGTDYVFGIAYGVPGEGYQSPGYLSKLWMMFADSNNVKDIRGNRARFHTLRHTFATHALDTGMNVETLAKILGHKDPSVTSRIYYDYLPQSLKDEMDHMGRVMSN